MIANHKEDTSLREKLSAIRTLTTGNSPTHSFCFWIFILGDDAVL